MKNFFLISLVIIIVLHTGIIDTLFDIKQQSLKKEVQLELNSEKGFSLKLTIQKFQKLSVSKNEIMINKEFYDVISLKKENNFIYLTISKDHKENNYLAKIKYYKNKNNPHKSKTNSFKTKLVLCNFKEDVEVNNPLNYNNTEKLIFYKISKLSKKLGEIIIPPPELA